MKKAIASVFRLAMFVGILLLLSSLNRAPQAQAACETFQIDDIDCPSGGCTQSGVAVRDYASQVTSGTGTEGIQNATWSCGKPVSGGTFPCSGEYPQVTMNNACCLFDGQNCASNELCCNLCLSNGKCGSCSGTGGSCGANGDCCNGGTCTNGTCAACQPNGSPPYCGNDNPEWDTTSCSWICVPPGGNSPILIDVSGNGFQLTSATNGVSFDISGTGTPAQIAWTAPGAANAFLCLPDGDGRCDDGKDLFGNFTPQPPSPNPNGFVALAVYDRPSNGGNGDGIIDSRDAIYSSLRLWIDANHDGISQPNELHTLPSFGVNSISLNYKADQRTDQYGNIFRYRAQINPNSTTSTGRTAYDVFFVKLGGATP